MTVNRKPSFAELHAPVSILEILTNRLTTLATLWNEPLRTALLHAAPAQAGALLEELSSENHEISSAAGTKVLQMGFTTTSTWYGTDLGRLVSSALYRKPAPASDAMTQNQAAAYLGISRQRVSILKRDGKLQAHPQGGVTGPSVIAFEKRRTAAVLGLTREEEEMLSNVRPPDGSTFAGPPAKFDAERAAELNTLVRVAARDILNPSS